MLFNVDRSTKQNMLNQYKQDALDYEKKKVIEKQRQIEEERNYLNQLMQADAQAQDKLRSERLRKQNEIKEDYQRMLLRDSGRPHLYRSKIEDVKIKNYGYDPNRNDPKQYLQDKQFKGDMTVNPMKNIESEYNRAVSPSQREKLLIRREDHMGNYLTDKVNEGEIKNYFKNQKLNQQMYYKKMLDDQVNY